MVQGFTFVTGTNSVNGEKLTINLDYIESIEDAEVNEKKCTRINMISGKQYFFDIKHEDLLAMIKDNMQMRRIQACNHKRN